MPVKAITIQVIHGPNLNLLGTRETSVYGKTTLAAINTMLKKIAQAEKIRLAVFQSNHEGEILDKIHAAKTCNGILINPAAFTHTSVALRDALLAVAKPLVEVHLSNVYAREDFRKLSFISDIAVGVVSGFGALSYELGLRALLMHLQEKTVSIA